MFPINWLAVIVSTVLYMVLGYLWYSPLLFQKAWIRSLGWNARDIEAQRKQGGMAKVMGTTVLSSLVQVFVLSYLIWALSLVQIVDGVVLAVIAWIGLVIPASLAAVLFERRPKGAFYISMLYYLCASVLAAIILVAWR